jgi:DNA-binding IclR family transcriptional regulator
MSTPTSVSVSASSSSAPAAASHRTSRSLIYGLALLRQFTAERPERGITELAQELGVSRATAHRYASTCLELGYLEQDRRRRYRLARRCAAPGVAALGTLALSGVGERVLRELRERTGRTVGLAVLDGTEVVYLRRLCGYARGEYRLAKGLGAGSRRLARDTAAGRALLSVGDARSALIVDEGLRHGRARGLAFAIAVLGERTSALEVSAPADELSAAKLLAELGEPLRRAAATLRAALAADRVDPRLARATT